MFHRIDIDDVYDMPAPQFFKLAVRLFAYNGVIRARIKIEQQQAEQDQPQQQGSAPIANQQTAEDRTVMVESDAASIRANFGDLMDVAEV